ncbi:MAG TPA: Rieske 2Fe-2S domain-containing protein [Actinomycetes bacterium]
MNPFESASILEDTHALDRVSGTVRDAVHAVLRSRVVRDALHGVWLGHPLHPVLVQVPVGAFASAGLLDALPGHEKSADLLVATGIASSVPAAAAGLADFAEMHEQQRRVGVVHAAANTVALALYSGSLVARVRGDRGVGRLLGYLGLSVVGLSGYLGGHLAYRQAAGANHAEEVPHLVPPGWHDLCAVDDLGPAGEGRLRMLGEGAAAVPLLVVRRGDRIDVLSNRCTHLAGPLHEGSVDPDAGCVTCPWHGSVFSLDDGSVLGGPATAPAHAFDVRVEGGRLMVRLAGAG